MAPGNGAARRDQGRRKRKSPKTRTRRVKLTLSLGTLITFAKTVDEPFDDLQVVHVEQRHPIPRWWWISTSLMGAALIAAGKWLAAKIGLS